MHGSSIGKWLGALMLCAAWIGPAAAVADAAGETPARAAREAVVDLIAARLELMPAVAAAKWRQGQPIEDPAREAVVMADALAAAARHGLDGEPVGRLFRVQMAAARAVQAYWLEAWASGRAQPPEDADLAGDIRPRLSGLGESIVSAAARAAADGALEGLDRAAFDARLALPGLAESDRDALFEAVSGIRVLPNRLARILASGRLRVGTTGDYAPFSERTADLADAPAAADATPGPIADEARDYTGIDIDLALDLAESIGVKAEFVLTSWPGLLTDLALDRYDIAMSGISRIPARQRVGFLTQPYHADGKTPIGRCADRRRFDAFERIDRAGVRVVVNPGGTNERFVDERVRQATKVLHPDNRTIFAELSAGRADVMFTDRIEVELQTARNPALCGLLEVDLTYQEKAFLLPQDPHWLEFVDTWLALRLAEGAVDAAFAAHGVRRRPAGVSRVPSN